MCDRPTTESNGAAKAAQRVAKDSEAARALQRQGEDRGREHLQLVLADRWFAGCGFRGGAGPRPRFVSDHGRESEDRSPRCLRAGQAAVSGRGARGLHLSGRDQTSAGSAAPAPASGASTGRRVWQSAALVVAPGNPVQQTAGIKTATETELEQWFEHPLVRLHASQELRRIELYSEQIAELEKTILELAQTERSYELLQQLPGVGQTIALTILYEVGELTRFANVKVFSSYCRVVPGIAQSGNTGRGRASKQGNHYLKAAFSQAAVHAVRCYPKVRRYYERQLKRHQGRGRQMICYNIIAHKLAQAAFHILKEQTEYRAELLFGR